MFKERGSAKFNTFGKAFAVLMLFIFLISFVTGVGIGIGATDPRVGNIYFGQTPSGPSDMSFDGGNDSLFFFRNFGAENGMTSFSSNSGALMTIRNNGNVGIGTTSPSRKLHIIDTTEQALFEGSNQGAIKLKKTDSAYGYSIYSGANGELGFYDGANVNMYIQGGNIKIPSLASCNSISSNANGTLACGTGGGGTSQWTTTGSNIYYNTGNVGIGTTSPLSGNKLEVAGAITGQGIFLNNARSAGFYDPGNGAISFRAGNNDDVIRITPTGKVGIGPIGASAIANLDVSSNSNTKLRVISMGSGGIPHIDIQNIYANWQMRVDGLGYYSIRDNDASTNRLTIDRNGNVIIGGTVSAAQFITTSDARLKNIQGKYERGLDEIIKLQPVYFTFKDNNALGLPSTKQRVGITAQSVKQEIPEAVEIDNKGYLTLDNDVVLWTLVNAIQEQQQEIKELKDIVCKDKKNLNYCS